MPVSRLLKSCATPPASSPRLSSFWVSRSSRSNFLRSLTVLSVPARSGEAFGLYLIEAMAAGIPAVQPRLGAFPELIEATGGGVLCAAVMFVDVGYDPTQLNPSLYPLAWPQLPLVPMLAILLAAAAAMCAPPPVRRRPQPRSRIEHDARATQRQKVPA